MRSPGSPISDEEYENSRRRYRREKFEKERRHSNPGDLSPPSSPGRGRRDSFDAPSHPSGDFYDGRSARGGSGRGGYGGYRGDYEMGDRGYGGRHGDDYHRERRFSGGDNRGSMMSRGRARDFHRADRRRDPYFEREPSGRDDDFGRGGTKRRYDDRGTNPLGDRLGKRLRRGSPYEYGPRGGRSYGEGSYGWKRINSAMAMKSFKEFLGKFSE